MHPSSTLAALEKRLALSMEPAEDSDIKVGKGCMGGWVGGQGAERADAMQVAAAQSAGLSETKQAEGQKGSRVPKVLPSPSRPPPPHTHTHPHPQPTSGPALLPDHSPGIQALISGLKISTVLTYSSEVPPPTTYRRLSSTADPAQPRMQDMLGACGRGKGAGGRR
jgi:hypothetical protein